MTVNALNLSQSVKSVCHAGCAVIAAVTLRSPDNAKQVIAAGGADLVTQVMKTHANEPVIQVSEPATPFSTALLETSTFDLAADSTCKLNRFILFFPHEY